MMLLNYFQLFAPFGLLMEFRVRRPPPPSLVLVCLAGLVFLRDMYAEAASIPKIAIPVIVGIKII